MATRRYYNGKGGRRVGTTPVEIPDPAYIPAAAAALELGKTPEAFIAEIIVAHVRRHNAAKAEAEYQAARESDYRNGRTPRERWEFGPSPGFRG